LAFRWGIGVENRVDLLSAGSTFGCVAASRKHRRASACVVALRFLDDDSGWVILPVICVHWGRYEVAARIVRRSPSRFNLMNARSADFAEALVGGAVPYGLVVSSSASNLPILWIRKFCHGPVGRSRLQAMAPPYPLDDRPPFKRLLCWCASALAIRAPISDMPHGTI
jgi:hypothetical protein